MLPLCHPLLRCRPSTSRLIPAVSVLQLSSQRRSPPAPSLTSHLQQRLHQLRPPSAKQIVDASPRLVQPYLRIMRLDRPIGTWLLFLPCSWSLSLAAAPGLPSPELLALFGVGALLMRGAGCVVNDMWDRDFDRQVARTRDRPLASGALSERQAAVLLGGLLSCAAVVLLQLNWLSVGVGLLSLGPVAAYPLAKRYTHWPQAALGLTLNWGAILGWTAATGTFDLAPIAALYAAGISWTLYYDTLYAHQDKTDDVLIGVKSSALWLGERWTKPACALFASSTLLSLATAGVICDLGQLYWPTLAIAAAQLTRIVSFTS